jgi:hypothetical protein
MSEIINDTMKALSLRGPWAHLMAVRAKRLETRSWRARHRGWTAIHAASRMDDWERETALDPWFIEALTPFYHKPPEEDVPYIGIPDYQPKLYLPLGCYLSIGELTAAHQTESLDGKLEPAERAFGNYDPGRWAFEFATMRRLPRLIAGPGSLNFYASPLCLRLCAKCRAETAALCIDERDVECFDCLSKPGGVYV